jgi:SAM-dependent methyltransferase
MSGFNVCLVRPARFAHSDALREVAEALHFALLRLGQPSVMTENQWKNGWRPIVLGAHLLRPSQIDDLPSTAIVYNLEQLTPERLESMPNYRHVLERFEVWDYSVQNIQRFAELGLQGSPRLLPIGYVPEWTRIKPAKDQDIDVLFYGSGNERRHEILKEIEDAGLNVEAHFGVYGPHRDALIARSKVVLNVHFYDAEVFEMPRVAYLLANGVPVVAEEGGRTRVAAALREALCVVPREQIADACVELVFDPARRADLAERAYRVFSTARLEPLLAPLVGATWNSADAGKTYPVAINLGSGKDWREDCLNVDVEARWNPDVLLDIAQPISFPLELETPRLGRIAVCQGMYEQLIANDVLEHIPNLPAAMTNCLRLLKLGGELIVKVPYDLSYGAWQDPTHVRAFNERSFLYYTDWFWYLGWLDERFELAELVYRLSPLGKQLREHGTQLEEIARTPRAVDELFVRLRKRLTTEAERADALARRGAARAEGAGGPASPLR